MMNNEEDLMRDENNCLTQKICKPCQGAISPLTTNETEKLLHELSNGWNLNNKGHLYKEYKFSNFMKAIDFVNSIAKIAEENAHHPDLKIGWGSCNIEIWTHKINGLTESDFILAAKIEGLYE